MKRKLLSLVAAAALAVNLVPLGALADTIEAAGQQESAAAEEQTPAEEQALTEEIPTEQVPLEQPPEESGEPAAVPEEQPVVPAEQQPAEPADVTKPDTGPLQSPGEEAATTDTEEQVKDKTPIDTPGEESLPEDPAGDEPEEPPKGQLPEEQPGADDGNSALEEAAWDRPGGGNYGKVTVTFVVEEETYERVTLSRGETLKRPADPTVPDDSVFEYWATKDGKEFTGFGKPLPKEYREDFCLYACITKKCYSVCYEYCEPVPEGAPELPQATLEKVGRQVTVAADPTLEGYTFGGWQADSVEITDGKFTMPNHAVVLRGCWEPIPPENADYQVQHYLQDVDSSGAPLPTYTLAATDSQNGEVGGTATYSTRSFEGWAYDSTQTTYSDSNNPASSAVLPIAQDGSLALQLYYTRSTGGLVVAKNANLSGSYTFGIYTRTGGQYTQVRQVAVNAGQNSGVLTLATGVYFIRELSPQRPGYSLSTSWQVNGQGTSPNADGYVSLVVLAGGEVRVAATDIYTAATPTPAPTPTPDQHPEIGEAIQNGTWGRPNIQQTVSTTTVNRVPQTGDELPVQVVSILSLSAALALLLVYRAKNRAVRRNGEEQDS